MKTLENKTIFIKYARRQLYNRLLLSISLLLFVLMNYEIGFIIII